MKTFLSYRHIVKIITAGALLLAIFGLAFPVAAQSTCGTTYTVQRGDYLTKIARTCGVSYSDLIKANPAITSPSRIYPGQVINIPSPSIPVTGGKPMLYTVKTGDTLFNIAQRFSLTTSELREANMNIGSVISPGQVLNIPARIRFAAGNTAAVVDGTLEANGSHYYLLGAAADQTLEVTLSAAASASSTSSPVSMTIYGADGSTVLNTTTHQAFRGVLPRTQDYILKLTAGNSAVEYTAAVDIPVRIRFAAGATSASLTGTVPANLSQFYILRAAAGQTLNVTASPQNKLQLSVYGVDGTVLRSGMGEGAAFSGVLPTTQDYILVLKSANQPQAFTLNVSIPAGSTDPDDEMGSYIVQRGDTMLRIARRFQITVRDLLLANPQIGNPDLIYPGQRINIP